MSIILKIKNKAKQALLSSQRYIKIDMVYLAKGGFWISASFLINTLLSLGQVIIFANYLPKETYGTYKYILSLTGSLSFLTLTGMNMAVIQATAKYGSAEILAYAIKIQLKWNSLAAVALGGLGFYYFLNNNDIFAYCLFIMALAFPLATTFNTYGAFLTGKKNFKETSRYDFLSDLVSIIPLAITAMLINNVLALILVYAITSFVPSLYFCFRVYRSYKSDQLAEYQKKEISSFGKHLSLIHILSNIAQYVDKIIIFHFFGPSQLAIYGLAIAIPERLRGYQKSISRMLLPKLAEREIEQIDKIYFKRVLQGASVGLILCLGYVVMAPILYKLFLPKYLESLPYSRLFSLTLIFALPANYMSSVFNAKKMVGTLYKSSLFASILRISLYILFGSRYGIWGIIWSILAMHLIGTMYNFYLWGQEIKKQESGSPAS